MKLYLALFFSETEEEKALKEARNMIDELERQGTLQSIIQEAAEKCEDVNCDLGRGGAAGFKAFFKLTQETEDGDQQGTNFKQSLNARLNGSDKVASALEEELTRRFPAQLNWDRKAGPTVKNLANRIIYVTGEIFRHFEKWTLFFSVNNSNCLFVFQVEFLCSFRLNKHSSWFLLFQSLFIVNIYECGRKLIIRLLGK